MYINADTVVFIGFLNELEHRFKKGIVPLSEFEFEKHRAMLVYSDKKPLPKLDKDFDRYMIIDSPSQPENPVESIFGSDSGISVVLEIDRLSDYKSLLIKCGNDDYWIDTIHDFWRHGAMEFSYGQ